MCQKAIGTTGTNKAGDGVGVAGLQFYRVGQESLTEKVTLQPGLEAVRGRPMWTSAGKSRSGRENSTYEGPEAGGWVAGA